MTDPAPDNDDGGGAPQPASGPMSKEVADWYVNHPEDVHADAVQEHLDAVGVAVRRVDTATLGTFEGTKGAAHAYA